MSCVERFNEIRIAVPENIRIVAVSKTKPVSLIEEIYQGAEHKIFGENKAQELNRKHEMLPKDIEWHFIGHLQTNKIRLIAPFTSLVHSVDSFKLLNEINKEAKKNNRIIPCLLQFHIAREEAKYGFSLEEAFIMLEEKSFQELTNVSINGVMGMATYTDDKQQIRAEFTMLYKYFNLLKSDYFSGQPAFCEVSMGMTDDYKIAIDEGSTIIRIGSGIFGEI